MSTLSNQTIDGDKTEENIRYNLAMSDETKWYLCNSETSYQSEELTWAEAKTRLALVPRGEREHWYAWQEHWTEWKPILAVDEFRLAFSLRSPPPMPPPQHAVLQQHEEPSGDAPSFAPVAAVPETPIGVLVQQNQPEFEPAQDEDQNFDDITNPLIETATAASAEEAIEAVPALPVPSFQEPPALQKQSGDEPPALPKEAVNTIVTPPAAPMPASPSPVLPRRMAVERRHLRPEERRKHQRVEVRLRVIIRNEHMTFRTFTRDLSLGGVSLENPLPDRLLQDTCQIFIAGPDHSENIRFTLKPTERRDWRYFSFANVERAHYEKLEKWLKSQMAQIAKRVG